eukprot:9247679-Ditylum_brightwellii.AAC.1
MTTEMHSVLMQNNAVGVSHKSKDIESVKEAVERRAQHHLLTLIVSSSGGIADKSKKQDYSCTRMILKALLEVSN